jgi:hypothetical protein
MLTLMLTPTMSSLMTLQAEKVWNNLPRKETNSNTKPVPKAMKEKCQCKGCPSLPLTNLCPLMKCGVQSCQKQLHCIGCKRIVDDDKTACTIEDDLSSALLAIMTSMLRTRTSMTRTTWPGRMMEKMGQTTCSVLSSTLSIGCRATNGTCAGATLAVHWLSWRSEKNCWND